MDPESLNKPLVSIEAPKKIPDVFLFVVSITGVYTLLVPPLSMGFPVLILPILCFVLNLIYLCLIYRFGLLVEDTEYVIWTILFIGFAGVPCFYYLLPSGVGLIYICTIGVYVAHILKYIHHLYTLTMCYVYVYFIVWTMVWIASIWYEIYNRIT
jgi:hypothetical protein